MSVAKHGEVLADVRRLESLPQVVLKALELLNDPRATPSQLADVLALDPSLAARILALAASAYYGTPHRPRSLREALVRVGFNAVQSLIVTASVAPRLHTPLPGYMLDRGQLWRHAVACGMCARLIASAVGYRDREDAYLAGLLHDIGKLIMDRHLHTEFPQVVAVVAQQQIPFVEAERLVIGYDHAQIGQLMVEKWHLAPSLAEAVGFHHRPLGAPTDSLLPHIVHVANVVTRLAGVSSGDYAYAPADPAVVSQLGLSVGQIDALTVQLDAALADADGFLRLDS